jgi:hypothetical protein
MWRATFRDGTLFVEKGCSPLTRSRRLGYLLHLRADAP